MSRALRAGIVLASAGLFLTVSASYWLGLQPPWSQSPVQARPSTVGQPQTTSTPADPYEAMGTLTLRGRTIPSTRLAHSEFPLVEWLADSGLKIDEIRPAPPFWTVLRNLLQGVAVVHVLIGTSAVIDVAPIDGALDASLCTLASEGVLTYRLRVHGRATTFSYPRPLYVVSHDDTLLMTDDPGTRTRLLNGGGSPVLCSGGRSIANP